MLAGKLARNAPRDAAPGLGHVGVSDSERFRAVDQRYADFRQVTGRGVHSPCRPCRGHPGAGHRASPLDDL
jgi:predicted phosphoribosyltransferase